MYSSLLDAPINLQLDLLEITDPQLERWLQRLGLFVGATLTRHDREFNFFAVRARGKKGDVIIPAGLAMKIYIHIESGEKIPLTEMKKEHQGHMELHSGGKNVQETLKKMGFEEGEDIHFVRCLPHMDYITIVDKNERTRLSEGEAASIWGYYPEEKETQFYFARKHQDFTVTEILGGQNRKSHLKTHGIEQGSILTIESIEQVSTLHAPASEPVTISTKKGLRLYLTREQADAIIVRTNQD